MNNIAKILIILSFVFLLFNGAAAQGDDRFVDNGNGTVTDQKLGLMWAKSDNQGDINRRQAEKWVKYTFPYTVKTGYYDWRLPTLEELASLYVKNSNYEGYEADCGQKVKIIPEIQLSCALVWSSAARLITSRLFNFNRGIPFTDRKMAAGGYRVLPVRTIK